MSAQFDTYEYHGTNLNSSALFLSSTAFRNSDTAVSYINYPIAIPDTHGLPVQTNRSYETVVRLVCAQAPDTSCINFRIWKDYVEGDDGQGVLFFAGTTDAVFTPTSNNSPIAVHSCDGSQGNALGNSWDWDRQTTITVATQTTRYVVLQMDVTAAAVQASDNRMFHFAYDES